MSAFFLLVLAIAVSMLLIPLACRAAPYLGMIDMPDARKVHAQPVPRVGGWGIVLGCITPLLLLFPFDPLLQSFVGGALVLFVFGMWDDAREIGHWPKFAGQIIAAALVVYHGDLYVTRLPFIEPVTLSAAFCKPFTVFALVGVINAINHSDGLDGLAGGESLLSLMAMAVLGYLVDSALVVGIALTTIGGTLGFLRYNTHPARVFMGDAGSQVLGFTLGFLAVYLTQVASTAVSAALPLLLLGLPITDILAVLFQRIRGGMNWFRATRNHVHHRLLDLGFSHFWTVVTIYSLQAGLVIAGVLLRYQSDLLVTGLYVGVIAALFATLIVCERRGWRLRRKASQPTATSAANAGMAGWLANPRVRNFALGAITAAVAAFMLSGVIWVSQVPMDFGVIAALLAVLLLVQLVRNRAVHSLAVRAAIYSTVAFSVYLLTRYPGSGGSSALAVATGLIVLLALMLAVYIRFMASRQFGTTPTDYLVVFGLLALIAFGSVDVRTTATAQFVSYVIILFYACEVVLGRVGSRWHPLYWSTLAALLIAGFRGIPVGI